MQQTSSQAVDMKISKLYNRQPKSTNKLTVEKSTLETIKWLVKWSPSHCRMVGIKQIGGKKNEAKAQEGTQVCMKEIKFTLWSICGPPQPNDSYH